MPLQTWHFVLALFALIGPALVVLGWMMGRVWSKADRNTEDIKVIWKRMEGRDERRDEACKTYRSEIVREVAKVQAALTTHLIAVGGKSPAKNEGG